MVDRSGTEIFTVAEAGANGMTTMPRQLPNVSRSNRLPVVLALMPLLLLAGTLPESRAAPREYAFDNPFFQRCMTWLLDGTGGAMIGNVCIDQYDMPPPSLFICARKVMTGFESSTDQEGCAILFEDQARKIRAGYVK
jgi:hypothetical protein